MIAGFGAQFVVPGLVAVDLAQPVLGAVLRTATPRHRRARCRPRLPTRERTCWGWPPIGRLPALSRTSRSPRGGAAPGTPANASRCRRRTRRRRPRHPSRPGAGRRGAPDRGWRHPGPRHRRPSCRRGRTPSASPSALDAARGASSGSREGRPTRARMPWSARAPSRPTTPATRSRRRRRSPRWRRARLRRGACESGSAGSLLVPVCCGSCRHSRQRGVARAYAVFDMPAICAGS